MELNRNICKRSHEFCYLHQHSTAFLVIVEFSRRSLVLLNVTAEQQISLCLSLHQLVNQLENQAEGKLKGNSTFPRSRTLFKFLHQISCTGASKQIHVVVADTTCDLFDRFHSDVKTPSIHSPDGFTKPNIRLTSDTARALIRSNLCSLVLLLPSNCLLVACSLRASIRFSIQAVFPLPPLPQTIVPGEKNQF